MNKSVILERRYHEKGIVYAASDIARQYGIPNMPAPHGEALTIALFKVTSARNCPKRIALKNTSAGLNLVVDVNETCNPSNPTCGLFDLSLADKRLSPDTRYNILEARFQEARCQGNFGERDLVLGPEDVVRLPAVLNAMYQKVIG